MVNGIKRPASKDRSNRSKKSKASTRNVKAGDSTSSSQHDNGSVDNNEDVEQVFSVFQDTVTNTIEHLRKPDPWTKAFREYVDGKEAELLKELDGMRNKITSRKAMFASRMLKVLSEALQPIALGDSTTSSTEVEKETVTTELTKLKVPFTTVKGQKYFDAVTDLVSDSYALTNIHKDENERKRPVSRTEQLISTLKKDQNAALAAVEAAKKVAMQDVKAMLADRYHEVREESQLTPAEELKGRLLLPKTDDNLSDGRETVCWGDLAMNTTTALKKLEDVGKRV